MYNAISKIKSLWFLALAAAIVISCQKDDDTNYYTPPDHERAEVKEITSMGVYSPEEISQLLAEEEVNHDYFLGLSVEAYSVKYYSEDAKGNDIIVSGAMFIPKKRSPLAMMSIQPGTKLKRDGVASVSPERSSEGICGLMTASLGYITVVPDYPGYGVSRQNHQADSPKFYP